MFEKCNPNRVKGFLRAEGTKVVNGDGEEVVMLGWGVGNWLLQEGYMWLSWHDSFDRPRRIEDTIKTLTGSEYADKFWKTFRDRYITKADIQNMYDLGYNSVRIPFNWRVLMKEEPGYQWCEEGFALIDRCLDWCEEVGIYAILDLHGAPGSQSGWNTDDSVGNLPRLLMDEDYWDKGIELWREIARRYKDRWIVGSYDLLNEPVRPNLCSELSRNKYISLLSRFYEECVMAIREIDQVHMLQLEGGHFSTDNAIFFKRYDDNMLIHFHRYAVMPGMDAFDPYLKVSQELDQPLWVGETGENKIEWFNALTALSLSLDIGVNLWPWKKMVKQNDNSPCDIKQPEGWDEIITFIDGGKKPSYERAQQIFDEYLDNILIENCVHHTKIHDGIFKKPTFTIRATDFDQFPGQGQSFSGTANAGNEYRYRMDTKMRIEAVCEETEKEFWFDCGWDQLGLVLETGEFADYTVCSKDDDFKVSITLECQQPAKLKLIWTNGETAEISLDASVATIDTVPVTFNKDTGCLRVVVEEGKVRLHRLSFAK